MLLLNYSCRKISENEEKKTDRITNQSMSVDGVGSCMEVMENDADTSEVPTLLGNQLQGNPYSVSVMQQASINLYGNSSGIAVNKLYVRFKPANDDQLFTLEALDLDLFDHPLDYEVLHQGDYYPQPGIGPDEIPWLYGIVDVGFQPPAGIQYEILQNVHIPDKDIWLEQEAFRITGNTMDDSCGIIVNRLPLPCDDPCNPGPGCPLPSPECGGGGDVPPDPRVPTGKLYVWDNRLDNGTGGQGTIVPVRRIRVIARNFLKTERVYTNDAGAFAFTKKFKKVHLIVKMKNNNTIIRGLFGFRIWNITWALKKNIGEYKGNLSNIQYTFFRQENVKSRGMQDWVGVTVFNKRMDFNGLSFQDNLPGTPAYLDMFITSWASAAAAPMFPHRYPNNTELLELFARKYMINSISIPGGLAARLNNIIRSRVDVVYGYNKPLSFLDSDDISEVIFHELSHTQHYNKVGNNWWHNFVWAEMSEIFDYMGTRFDPYGPGNTGWSSIIALGESWAYHYGRVLADRVYGNYSSAQFEQGFEYQNGTIWFGGNLVAITGLNAHLNLLEDFDKNRTDDPFFWIPQGLYYDLNDNRNDIAFNRVLLDDQVSGYTNEQFFNALDFDITSLQNYQLRLLQENNNNQALGVNSIFQYYGY